MTWWSGGSDGDDETDAFGHHIDDLRTLVYAILVRCGKIVGKQLTTTDHPAQVAESHRVDYNGRPVIVAIYIALLNIDRIECAMNAQDQEQARLLAELYPDAPKIAQMIASRKFKTRDQLLMRDAESMNRYMRLVTGEAYRIKTGNSLPEWIQMRIALFAETMVRASQLYRAFINKNKCNTDIDLSFGVKHIKMAADELYVESLRSQYEEEDIDDVPKLLIGDDPELLIDMQSTENVQNVAVHVM